MEMFNFITNVLILVVASLYFINKKFYIQTERTFWSKKLKGVHVMKRDSEVESHGILYIPLRLNGEKLDEWDDKQFKSGEYKKYR